MNKVKIVHASDMHFDTPFKEIGASIGKISREELKEVFSNIINFCIDNEVQILLLSGDIFDNITLNKETIYFLEKVLKMLTSTRVFISPGNHDPYGKDSFYSIVNWPKNVYIFKGKIEKVYLSDLHVNVWGAGFTERYERESLIEGLRANDECINILVIHGEITQGNEKNEYNPISLNDIKSSNMDYIALGHRHKFSGIKKIENTSYAYSGCIQGRGFDETLDKGIIYGDIYKENADLKFVRMSKRNYFVKEIDVSGVIEYEELADKILNLFDKNERKINFYKIILKGQINEEFNIDEEVILRKIESEFYFVKIIDKTVKKINIDEISEGYSVKGIFTKKLLEKYNSTDDEEEKEIIEMAIRYGIESLTDDEVSSL